MGPQPTPLEEKKDPPVKTWDELQAALCGIKVDRYNRHRVGVAPLMV